MWTLVVGIVALAATIPRLVINYGMDGDAIRSVISARALLETGVYEPSRLPGNPLFEYALALLCLADGWVASNALALLSFGAATAAFAMPAKDREHSGLLVGLFALTPILLVNAASTMDYLPGLAAILWSYNCARRGRYTLAYLLLAASIGLRLSNALFAVPLGAYLFLSGVRCPRILLYSACGVAAGLVFYLPILIGCGVSAFHVPGHAYHGISYVMLTAYRFLMLFGPLASAGIGVLLLINIKKIIDSFRNEMRARAASFAAEFSAAALFIAMFLRHSDESEYLIPAIPFFYLLVQRWLDRRQLIILAALVISAGIVSVELKGGQSGRRHVAARLSAGIIVKDYLDRKELEALRKGASKFDKAEKAVIIHGYGPVLGYGNPDLKSIDYREISSGLIAKGISDRAAVHRAPGKEIFYVSGLSRENVAVLVREGFKVFCFSDSAPSHLMHTWGYDPYEIGVERLNILNEEAFYRSK